MMAALRTAEEIAAARMEQRGRELADDETATLLDDAVAFAQAGIAAISGR